MARINLLPWRQEERERKNKEFNVIAAAAAALAVLAVLAAMTFLGQQLSNQQAANDLIRNENTRLDGVNKEIEGLEQQRDEMISRMKIIQDLQGQRSIPVRVWDDIARAIPQSMYLTNMKREGNTITLTGFADNPNVVSQLIRNLDASPWLANSGVPNIKTEAQAYQSATPANKSNTTTSQPRPIYPEDSYMEFTVTTQVKLEENTATSADGLTTTPENAGQPMTAEPIPNQAAPNQVPAQNQPQVTTAENPNVSPSGNSQPAATPVAPSAPQQPATTQVTPAPQQGVAQSPQPPVNEQQPPQGQMPPVAAPAGSQVGGQ